MIYKQKEIEHLFQKGHSFWTFPFVVYFDHNEDTARGFKLGISVPKRKFRKAVDRNRAKRVITEAFRTTRRNYESQLLSPVSIFVVYKHDKLPEYDTVKAKFVRIFEKIIKEQEGTW